MAVEIERKFLVTDTSYRRESEAGRIMKQGFLNLDPDRTVRVRISEGEAWLTVKGPSNLAGTTRFEWETPIPEEDAEDLLKLVDGTLVHKKRFRTQVGRHVYEVDEFFGDNEGLIIAEIELKDENEDFQKPRWLGMEVTGDIRYYNAQLCINPYKEWKEGI